MSYPSRKEYVLWVSFDGHLTTAYDIALMSRELITKYPKIHDYSLIWMDTITHETKKGSKEFGLTNTNKLVRQYQYTTGLKTGSTGKAKFCVSATAKKDKTELIAVVMAAPDPKGRFQDAANLLNYGFAKCQFYSDPNTKKLKPLTVKNGTKDTVDVSYETPFQFVDTKGSDLNSIKKEISLPKTVTAPVKKGDVLGKATYSLDGKVIGEVNIVSEQNVKKAGFSDYFKKLLHAFF